MRAKLEGNLLVGSLSYLGDYGSLTLGERPPPSRWLPRDDGLLGGDFVARGDLASLLLAVLLGGSGVGLGGRRFATFGCGRLFGWRGGRTSAEEGAERVPKGAEGQSGRDGVKGPSRNIHRRSWPKFVRLKVKKKSRKIWRVYETDVVGDALIHHESHRINHNQANLSKLCLAIATDSQPARSDRGKRQAGR